MTDRQEKAVLAFADELYKWWTFDDLQQPTSSWQVREDFITQVLPDLLAEYAAAVRERAARLAAILVGESPTSIGVQSML